MSVFVWLHQGYLALENCLVLSLSVHLDMYWIETWAYAAFALVHSTYIKKTLLPKPVATAA